MADSKRRKYLINARFQLRWTGFIAGVGGIIAALFTVLLWMSLGEQDVLLTDAVAADQKLRSTTEDVAILLLNMPETTAEEAQNLRGRFENQAKSYAGSAEIKQNMLERNVRTRIYLVFFVLLIAASLFVWGIIVTHRIAGPLYVIKAQLHAFRTKNTISPRSLRRHDEFQDVYDELKLTLGEPK